MPLLSIECQDMRDTLCSNEMRVQIFHMDLLTKSMTDPNHVMELMDRSAAVLTDDEFSPIF